MPYKTPEDTRMANRRYYQRHKEQLAEKKKEYRAQNKEKVAETQKKYYERNKEELATNNKRWRQDNKEKLKKYKTEYYQKNKVDINKRVAKWRAEHKELHRARARRFHEQNPESGKVSRHRRRARIAKAGGRFTAEDIRNMYATQGAKCYYCSISIEDGYHIDHMLPISRCGTNSPENLCLACAPCNFKKHTKTAEEFISVG